MRYTLRRAEKLHREKDFQHVLKDGRRLVHPAIFIYMYRPAGEFRRLGLITSRKLGNAVRRNRLKRRLREIFRLNKYRLPEGTDVVVIPRPPAMSLGYRELETIVLALFEQFPGNPPGETP